MQILRPIQNTHTWHRQSLGDRTHRSRAVKKQQRIAINQTPTHIAENDFYIALCVLKFSWEWKADDDLKIMMNEMWAKCGERFGHLERMSKTWQAGLNEWGRACEVESRWAEFEFSFLNKMTNANCQKENFCQTFL